MENLGQELAAHLAALLADGFVPPLHIAGLAINGEAFVLSYVHGDEGLHPDWRLEPRATLMLPLNLMVVDSDGKAARLSIDPQ